MIKKTFFVFLSFLLSACGDFPEYSYDQSNEYCALTFPFAAGLIGRKYIGYFNLTSTVRYLDAEPEMAIFVGRPSHIELEPGSLQKIEIADEFFVPEFRKNYLQPELQYWGPAFLFDHRQASRIYELLQQGNDLNFHGRVEVGQQYHTQIYNFFFDDADEPFQSCINRLLDENDLNRLQDQ